MISTALCIMLLMRAASIHPSIQQPKKVEISWAQSPPTCPSNGFARIKRITYQALSIRGPKVVFCTWVSEHKTRPHCRYGWMDGWTDGWMYGWMDGGEGHRYIIFDQLPETVSQLRSHHIVVTFEFTLSQRAELLNVTICNLYSAAILSEKKHILCCER